MNRRNFLKLCGIAAAGTGLSTWMLSSLASSPNIAESDYLFEPVTESWVKSLCGICGCGCGISVRLLNGIPIKIEGNKLHPMNRGGLCVKGQAGLEVLYNPARIKKPQKRVGERGEGRWQDISWEEALTILAGQLKNLITSHQANNLIFLAGTLPDPLSSLLKQFCSAFGSSYFFKTGLSSPNQSHFQLMHGTEKDYAYDLENSNYILNFGSPFLESEPARGWFSRMYGLMRRGRTGKRAKIVYIDSQLSVTGIKADEWIPIKPGTYDALALGIAHILIRENLVNDTFLKNKTFGYENWRDSFGQEHIGFKTLVLQNYAPETVAEITGIEAETTVRLAQEFASFQPSLALVGSRCNWLSHGIHTSRAVHALNALIGNIGSSGGIIARKSVPFSVFDSEKQAGTNSRKIKKSDKNQSPAQRDWINSEELTNLLAEGQSAGKQTLFLAHADPLYFSTKRDQLKQALSNVSMIISFSTIPNETDAFADLILPDHTYFEKWQAITTPPAVAGNFMGIAKPVIKPLYDTKDLADIFLDPILKKQLNLSKSLPWDNFESYLKSISEQIYNSERGLVFQETYDESWIKYLEQRGWRYPAYLSFEEFWDDMLKKGGWWEPQFQTETRFKTPSKRFEFYSQILKASKTVKPEDVPFLPHLTKKAESGEDAQYNFQLSPYILSTVGSGEGAVQPSMLEIMGIHLKQRWSSWIELNPMDAEELHVKDNDWVWLSSANGKLKIRVRIMPTSARGTINAPLGLGHKTGEKQIGVNLFPILNNKFDPSTGQIALLETRVKIEKIV